jgi:NAD(P)-dependent dehydrogenase (short-subunit alcohol dehydrogenase family)
MKTKAFVSGYSLIHPCLSVSVRGYFEIGIAGLFRYTLHNGNQKGYTLPMTRGILIAGNESSLFWALSAEAARRVESFAAAAIPTRFSLPAGKGAAASAVVPDGSTPLQWNPASPISARTLVLAAENRLGRIDDALLVCSPPAVYRSAETLLPAEVEILVNDHIKGWFFLVRELALVFRSRQRGTLAMVVPDISGGGRDPSADLLGLPAAASFRAFAQGLLASSVGEPFQILGFSSSEAGREAAFADWLFKIIDEAGKKNSGKWYKYTRFSLF